MPRGLVWFLLLLAILVLPGLLARLPPGRDEAIRLLHDGALDRNARRSALAIVLRGGRDPQASLAERLAGACAAIELEDRGGYLQIRPQLDPTVLAQPVMERAALGQAHLRELLAGWRAQAVGDPDTARGHYSRAALAARFAGAALAQRLAEEAQAALPR